jgi:hypothetical protein
MNVELYKKLLTKMSLKDLFNEIKTDETLLTKLALSLFKKRPKLLVKIISETIQNIITDNNEELSNLVKEEIIELDNSAEISINKITKKKNDSCSCSYGFKKPC